MELHCMYIIVLPVNVLFSHGTVNEIHCLMRYVHLLNEYAV